MGLTGIVDLLLDSATFTDVLRRVEQGAISTHISGLSGSQKSLFISGLFRHASSTIFVVTSTQQDAESLSGDISALIGPELVFVFPPVDVMPYEETPMSAGLCIQSNHDRVSQAGVSSVPEHILVLQPSSFRQRRSAERNDPLAGQFWG
jgi:transcription-repair coupling factor (superfamily II helicase)